MITSKKVRGENDWSSVVSKGKATEFDKKIELIKKKGQDIHSN